MPSTSAKQHRFMEIVAHNPKFAKEVDVPQSVGREFASADEAKSGKSKRGRIYNHPRSQKANAGG